MEFNWADTALPAKIAPFREIEEKEMSGQYPGEKPTMFDALWRLLPSVPFR